jgi:hypothetical protein
MILVKSSKMEQLIIGRTKLVNDLLLVIQTYTLRNVLLLQLLTWKSGTTIMQMML